MRFLTLALHILSTVFWTVLYAILSPPFISVWHLIANKRNSLRSKTYIVLPPPRSNVSYLSFYCLPFWQKKKQSPTPPCYIHNIQNQYKMRYLWLHCFYWIFYLQKDVIVSCIIKKLWNKLEWVIQVYRRSRSVIIA